MDKNNVILELKRQYPGFRILLNDQTNPTEIICEVEPANINPDISVSIVVFDGSLEHLHRETKDTYEVLKGELIIELDGREYFLVAGKSKTINPNQFHSVRGNDVWIKVTSTPAWEPKGYFPVN